MAREKLSLGDAGPSHLAGGPKRSYHGGMSILRFCTLAMLTVSVSAQTPFRMIKALSGPSGKVDGSKFVFNEVRSNFEYPRDKEIIVYFEWAGAPGTHHLSGIWKDPSGRSVQISDIELEAKKEEFAAYWAFTVVEDMMPGVWELQVRINGIPAGSHVFNLNIPPVVKAAEQPKPGAAAVRPIPTLDEVFRQRTSLVWVDKMDTPGRRIDRATGFVSGANQITTAFQAIDGTLDLEVEFADGRRAKVSSIAAWNRLQDWAVVTVETKEAAVMRRAESVDTPIGERFLVFNVENNVRTIGGVDFTGRDRSTAFGERLSLNPPPAMQAVGGPLMSKYGEVLGVVGGSLAPGSRIPERALAVSPGLYNKHQGMISGTPVHGIPAQVLAKNESLEGLMGQGVLTAPLRPHPNVKYGATARKAAKRDVASSQNDATDFSRKDEAITVYAQLEEVEKAKNAMISAIVFDAQNRARITVPAMKAKWAGRVPVRWAAEFAPAQLEPGIYRVDIRIGDQTAWRSFIQIRD